WLFAFSWAAVRRCFASFSSSNAPTWIIQPLCGLASEAGRGAGSALAVCMGFACLADSVPSVASRSGVVLTGGTLLLTVLISVTVAVLGGESLPSAGTSANGAPCSCAEWTTMVFTGVALIGAVEPAGGPSAEAISTRGSRGDRTRHCVVDEVFDVRVAGARGASAEHDRDDVAIAAVHRGDDVEAGFVDIAGLDAVNTGDIAEQMIMSAYRAAAEIEAAGREIMEVLREAVAQRASDDRLIARGGHLRFVRQAGRVVIDRMQHAEAVRLRRHHMREIGLIASERLADHDRDIVGRLRNDCLDGVLDADAVAGLESHLGRRLGCGMRRHRQFGRELQLPGVQTLEQQIERHHLG